MKSTTQLLIEKSLEQKKKKKKKNRTCIKFKGKIMLDTRRIVTKLKNDVFIVCNKIIARLFVKQYKLTS